MRHYEVTFIVDPVLSGDEIKTTAQTYVDMLQQEGCTIIHKDEMGLRQLAYPIKKRNSGIYFCVEFQSEAGAFIPKVELALTRDERIMRFLTVALDKFGIKYNDDKRKGLIGKKARKAVAAVEGEGISTRSESFAAAPIATAATAAAMIDVPVEEVHDEVAPIVAAPVVETPVVEAPVVEAPDAETPEVESSAADVETSVVEAPAIVEASEEAVSDVAEVPNEEAKEAAEAVDVEPASEEPAVSPSPEASSAQTDEEE